MNDGGPAFPMYKGGGEHDAPSNEGMSLRDYLAAKALQGFMANPTSQIGGDHITPAVFASVAVACYAMADAMLSARGK